LKIDRSRRKRKRSSLRLDPSPPHSPQLPIREMRREIRPSRLHQ
jgi:hypothetical protein